MASKKEKLRFTQKLILQKYLLDLFEVKTFEDLTADLKDEKLEYLTEDNTSRYYIALTNKLFENPYLPSNLLKKYDENIVRHTLKLQGRRHQPIRWKYFQYFSLLLTEIYLDKYFTDSDTLLNDLNANLEDFNRDKEKKDQISNFHETDTRKIAFWMATGSGKTLIMHMNIMQYKHYLKIHNRGKELNRTILLTPNEGLSKQHLKEFKQSGMKAELFNKEGTTLFQSNAIEIIDIHKLKDTSGEKTVAIDSFEGNNLVLVDEGHRGSSGIEWKAKRDKLCENGFSFEYSATFGQAIKASGKEKLENEYAKSIIFDYSYKFFYQDGYGKDYRILNLDDNDDANEERRTLYLTACLLSFYQQLLIFKDKKSQFNQFNLEKPLWIFVGGSVNAIRSENKRKVSDVVDILLFMNSFIRNKNNFIRDIDLLLKQTHGMVDSKNHNIFMNKFTYLIKQNISANKIYSDIIKNVFNSSTESADLHMENLKGIEGEIGLRVGNNDYFGVINVGDDSSLLKLCDETGLNILNKDFSQSLFHNINKENSSVNLLIGSKKFSEGWNSWRVSTMGLMNIGRSEGSEIIQLFGRGVRLKGVNTSLKRSQKQDSLTVPEDINFLETLSIFGVRANYMGEFKQYLEDEGLPTNDKIIDIILPCISNLGKIKNKLKFPRLKRGANFKEQGDNIILKAPKEFKLKNIIEIDLYPKIQALESLNDNYSDASKQESTLSEQNIAFLDYDEIYLELQNYKKEKGWYNFNIPKSVLIEISQDNTWYKLKIPSYELDVSSFNKIFHWQEIALIILKKYCEYFYNLKRDEFEKDKREYIYLDDSDTNMVNQYTIYIEESKDDIIYKLNQVKNEIEKSILKEYEFGNFKILNFNQHLYEPLIFLQNKEFKVIPVNLNEGEKIFLEDLKRFYQQSDSFFQNTELYVLRNKSKGQGLGFFEANNFYPDFVVWLIKDNHQYINFIDPKGLLHIRSLNDPKIQLHKTIKDIEEQMNDKEVTLNSFIISQTYFKQLEFRSIKESNQDFEINNVYFKEDANYIEKMLNKILQ